MDTPWFVYVLGSLSVKRTYVGCTNDVARRLRQHNGEIVGGAKSTQRCRPWELLKVYGPYGGRGEAQSVEYRVKKLRGLNRTRWEPPQAPDGP